MTRPSLSDRAAGLDLVPLAQATQADRMGLRAIRNEDGVRANMYSDAPIPEDAHRAWLGRVLDDPATAYFAVRHDGRLAGALAFTGIDHRHRRADWAFYLSAATRGRGLGRALELRALDLAFGPMALHKLSCEVIDWNAAVVALHRDFGFAEEGLRRDHVLRDGAWYHVHLLGLTAPDWAARRPHITGESP